MEQNREIEQSALCADALGEVLCARLTRYTWGESTSVTEETARRIADSILFSVGYALRCGQHTDLFTPAELEENGRHLLRQKTEEVKRLAQAARSGRIGISSFAYSLTLDEELAAFFREYDVEFGAQIRPLFFTYPPGIEPEGEKGVLYVEAYLRRICAENRFCAVYDTGELQAFLDRSGGRELPVNLFLLALQNALAARLSGRGGEGLSVSGEERAAIVRVYRSRTDADIAAAIRAAAISLADANGFCRQEREYLFQAAQACTPRIRSALRAGTLENVFPSL